MDPAVRTGKLDNGLTYYIRENQEPQDRAALWLVVNAGSVLEDEDQQGLAHFLEHMLFNGTQRFPGPALVDYLESLGIEFGPDLNAYTSFDETVYQLQVPTDQPELLDKGLDVLVDWAGAATLAPTEVDAERGVIVEEWRLRQETASGRILEQLVPMLLADSLYAERLPIGDMEIVRTAPVETLRRFYATWYRPDNMAVVAVGDFDADAVEAQIKEKFGVLTNPAAPSARPTVDVPVVPGDRYLVVTDPENPYATLRITHRVAPEQQTTAGDLRGALTDRLIESMLQYRFDELTQQPGAPMLYATGGRGELVRLADTFTVFAQTPDTQMVEGLDQLVTEVERVRLHGFTASELERAKTELLRRYELINDRRDDLNNDYFVQAYVDNFLRGDAFTSIPDEYALAQSLLPTVALDQVNDRARLLMAADDRAIVLVAPEREGLTAPTEATLAQTVAAATSRPITPYVDTIVDRPLLAKVPEPAAIVAERTLPGVEATEIELANGVHVIMKPTDFVATQVYFRGTSPGGASLVADAAYPAASTAASVAELSGVADFGLVELQKLLTGKAVGVSPLIDELEEGFVGSADPKDLETALQLVYLYATQPRFTADGLDELKEQWRSYLTNRSLSPDAAVEDALALALCGESVRCNLLPLPAVEGLTLADAEALYRERFADLGDSTFVFVGNFDPATLKELAQRYLGNLPAGGRQESWTDAIPDLEPITVTQEIDFGQGERSAINLVYRGPISVTLANEVRLSALQHLLDIRLREEIREERGGAYSPSAGANVSHKPDPSYQVFVNFTTDPARVDELLAAVEQLVADLRTNPTSDANLTKVKEQLLRSHEVNLRENGYWLDLLAQGVDEPARLEDAAAYVAAVDALTVEELRAAAVEYLQAEGLVQVVQNPAQKP